MDLYENRTAQKPELVVQTGHSDAVVGLAFSPDDRLLVTGSSDSTIKLWDIRTGLELRTITGIEGGSLVAFSDDGRRIAAGGDDKRLRLWDAASLKLVSNVDTGKLIRDVAFSPGGSILATASADGMVHLWGAADCKPLGELPGHKDEVRTIAFSSDGRTLASAGNDKTIMLWDVGSRHLIRTLPGHAGFIQKVFITPDGKSILSSSDSDGYKIWDLATGDSRQPSGERTIGPGVGFSPDGGTVAVTEADKTNQRAGIIRLRQVATGAEIRTLAHSDDFFYWYRFSHDGKVLAIGGRDATLKLWDVKGSEIHSLSTQSVRQLSISFSSNGALLAVGRSDRSIRIWDLSTRTAIATLAGHIREVASVTFSPDSNLLASAGGDHTARFWDVSTGKEVATLSYTDGEIDDKIIGKTCSVVFSPDGKNLAVGSIDSGVRVWDVATRREVSGGRLAPGDWINALAYIGDGSRVATAGLSTATRPYRVWDLGSGGEVLFTTNLKNEVMGLAVSPDGKLLAASGYGKFTNEQRLEIHDVSGQVPRLLAEHPGSALAFSPDSKTVAVMSGRHLIELRNASDWKGIQLPAVPEEIYSVAYHPSGLFLASSGSGPRIRLWDATSGRELASLFSGADGSWAVVDPEGRFDASSAGSVDWLHWVVGIEPITLDQLKERYYEPGLLAKLTGVNKEPARDVSIFESVELYPEVQVAPPAAGAASVGIRLTDRGGGIGRVQVLLNGKEIASDARTGAPRSTERKLDLAVDLSEQPFLMPGEENTIEVRAYNEAGYLSNRGLRVIYKHPGQALAERLSFWAIVVGIAEYQGGNLRLRYAAKDAGDMARAIRIGAERLFGAERTHVTLLTTAQEPGAVLPTRENLRKAFEAARRAKPTDILMVYMAGHGVNYGGQEGDYYYLTQEARSGDLTDPEVRRRTAVSSMELTDWIKQIPALKQILVLDTCAAARLVEKLTEKRDVPSSQIRSLERMKDRMGLYILAGSAADAVSYEASRYAQGLLTYSLLLGMRGAALRENGFVDVSKWFDYATDEVPELAKDIGGIQRPSIAIPRGGASFDIGQIGDEDKARIPLASVRPLFLQSNFQDEVRPIDHLKLMARVNEALREASAREQNATLVYVEASELPDAYLLAGRYRVEDGNVNTRVSVFMGDKEAGSFTVKGNTANLDQLAARIVAEAEIRIVTSG